MKRICQLASIVILFMPAVGFAECADWLDQKIGKLNSKETLDLCALTDDRPVLIVNTASHCGYTKQFKGLQALYERYQNKGLQIIGFPSNSFRQEANSEEKTAEVCYINYGVTFAMTEPVIVRGSNAHPVFKMLSSRTVEPGWNFNKYLIGRAGQSIEHFGSNVEPDDSQLIAAIDKLL